MDIKLLAGGGGFGDHLCTLSLLTDVPEPIIAHVSDRDQTYEKLSNIVRVLDIPKEKLQIEHTDRQGFFGGNLYLKIVSNYWMPEYVNVFNQRIKVDHGGRKPCIGFALYNGLDIYLDHRNNLIRGSKVNQGSRGDRVPECRYRSLDEYISLMKLVRSWGYDVITLDDPANLDLKVLNIVQNCAAVIGYEGGIAHLCHCLKVPYIMYKYREPNKEMCFGPFTLEAIHQSRHLYILEQDKELFTLDNNKFARLLDRLRAGNGNNRIANGTVSMLFKDGPNSSISFVDGNKNLLYTSDGGAQVTLEAAQFIRQFYPEKFQSQSMEVVIRPVS